MKTKLSLLFLVLISFSGFSQKNFWKISKQEIDLEMIPKNRIPSTYVMYTVNFNQVESYLRNAPHIYNASDSNIIFSVPDENGQAINLKIYKSGTMSKGLAASAPQIGTYRGVGIDNPTIKASITTSIFGLQIGIYRTGKPVLVAQPATKNMQNYIIYTADKLAPIPFQCGTKDDQHELKTPTNFSKSSLVNDGVLRKYRFAVGTTGEYSAYHVNRAINAGSIPSNATDTQKKDAVLAAVVTTIDRLNTVYEVDFGVELVLVSNEKNAIQLDAANDPYDNGDQMQMLNANTNALNAAIGSSNYDGGHLFSTYPGGGVSGLGVICGVNSYYGKAASITGLENPIGDHYDIDFVAHEVGHAFSANHTFANANQRNLPTSVEPGSGSTIMAYAGVSAPNVQMHSDAYFSKASIYEIGSFISNYATCAQVVNLGNHAPVITVNTHNGVKIPKSTPFILEASASDQDGDMVTYCWEGADIVTDNNINDYRPYSTYTTGPMFRSYSPKTVGTRMFPKIDDILDSSYGNEWEVLPSVARNLSFSVVARDNHAGGGQSPYSNLNLQVDGTAGPFRVTSQSTNTTWQQGSNYTITWNVAGTDANDVNCSTVDILFSTDGGLTFDTVLASNVPNNGSATITTPNNLEAYYGVIMVKGHNNYFFDLAKGFIQIGGAHLACNNTNSANNLNLSIPDNDPSGLSTTLNVTEDVIISSIKINVNLNHTYVQDLIISIVSPSGTEVSLWNRQCSGEDNINVTFDDDGSAISCASLTGNRLPNSPLSVFKNDNARGIWTLKISDNGAVDTGALNSWSINTCHVETSDIATQTAIKNLQIWPNPTQNNVNIKFDLQDINSKVKVSLTDMSGREIIRKEYEVNSAEFNQNINLTNFSKGIYLININNGKFNSAKKLIIR